MKKILITGGSGFIGTNFINLISNKNYKILNIDKISNISTPERFKLIKNKKKYSFKRYDLNDHKKIFKILKNFKPDTIINFAAESHVDRSINDPLYFIKNNIELSVNLFFAYVKFLKIKKSKFFQISTDEVYGSIPKGYSKEMDRYDPSSPYSASKGSVDLIASAFNKTYKTNIKIINLSNNYGPYQFPEKFIPTLILHFLKNKPAPIYGKGKNIREWIYVNDSCGAILKTIKSTKKFNKINIGSNKQITNMKIATTIFKIMKSKNLTKLNKSNFIKTVKDRPGHDERYALNTNFFKRNINYKIKKSLVIGLEDTINWYLDNKDWLKSILKKYNYKRLGLID
ncbi:GDP-mannose 4,6-dehydratase [Candidatus Pelagibacter sp.]|nr:GDP-mannose 4,6-dehydratase [Candidatus Pelagibacter sp.]